jgi:putative peptide zinc metalloprotease protein
VVTAALTPPATAEARVYRLAAGTELLGEYQDSAFEQAKFLVQRADGQVMQLPLLLYRVTACLDGRSTEQIAADLSEELGQALTGDQISFLVEDRLQPVGVIAAELGDGPDAGGGPAPVPPVKSDLLLALRYRVGVIPAEVAGRIAGVLGPLFRRPVWIGLVAAFLAVDAWILLRGDLVDTALAGVHQVVAMPALILLMLALTLVSGAFHEWGHITACRYGGARPGDVGVGLYIVWPALYSTVTDSYRLNRTGRLRTDLGGVYFDAIFMAGLGLVYLRTGQPWLLIALAGMHTETAWQFLPSIRLDGYYILADLVGVPDLFGFVKPALLSVLPGRPTHPKVRELKQRSRRVIILWVLLVVPTLLLSAAAFIVLAPRAIPVAWQALLGYLHTLGVATRAGDLVTMSLGVFQLILLLLPWIGSCLLLWWVVRAAARKIAARGWLSRVQATTWSALRRHAAIAALVGLGGLLVARVASVAGSHSATADELRLTDSAYAAVHGIDGPQVGAGELPVRDQLAAYARLTGAFDRHPSVLIGARELAILATAVLVAVLVALVLRLRLRPLVAGLPLAAALMMGPAVVLLATIGPAVLGAAWAALGLLALCLARSRGRIVLAGSALAVAIATEPLLAVPLLAGLAVLLARGDVIAHPPAWWSAGRGDPGATRRPHHAPERSHAPRHRASPSGRRMPIRWPGVGLVLTLGAVSMLLSDGHSAPPLGRVEQTSLLLLGGVVVLAALAWRVLRPAAFAVGALVTMAALPWTGAGSALVLTVPATVLLAMLLVESVTWGPVTQRPHPLLRALVAVPAFVLVAVGALFRPVAVGTAPHADVAAWITSPDAPEGRVAVPAGVWADLLRDGVPRHRLLPAPADDADWLVESGAPAPRTAPVSRFGTGSASLTVVPAPPSPEEVRIATAEHRAAVARQHAAETEQRAAEAEQLRRQAMGSLLAASPRFDASSDVLALMREGGVEVRVLVVLGMLVRDHSVVVADVPVAAGEGPVVPRHSMVLSRVDRRPAASPEGLATVGRVLDDTRHGPFAPSQVTPGASGLAIDWASTASPSR